MKNDKRFLTFAVTLTLLFTAAVPVIAQTEEVIGPDGAVIDTASDRDDCQNGAEVLPGGDGTIITEGACLEGVIGPSDRDDCGSGVELLPGGDGIVFQEGFCLEGLGEEPEDPVHTTFAADETTVFEDETVKFTLNATDGTKVTNSSFEDGDGNTVLFTDNAFVNNTQSVTYADSGSYTAWFNGSYDGTDFNHSIAITVEEAGASFAADATDVEEGTLVTFTLDGTDVSKITDWTFDADGDNTAEDGAATFDSADNGTQTFTYDSVGTYTAHFAGDYNGEAFDLTETITVSEAEPVCDVPDCVAIPTGGAQGDIFGMIFPDDGSDSGDILLHADNPFTQDSDGDGDSNSEELTGCGAGIPTNPFNRAANCDDYDGDGIPNDEDDFPTDPAARLLTLTGRITKDIAPLTGDELRFKYQCYGGIADEDLAISVEPGVLPYMGLLTYPVSATNPLDEDDISDSLLTIEDGLVFEPDANADGSGNCKESGNITLPSDFYVNLTDDRTYHDDGAVLFTLISQEPDWTTHPRGLDEVQIDVTNAAETGNWRMVCVTNMTGHDSGDQTLFGYDNGYCGDPGESRTIHGVRVTYDDNGFPDKHPHPNQTVVYDVVWEFKHTSYSAEKQNITSIRILDYTSQDPNSNDVIIGDADGDITMFDGTDEDNDQLYYTDVLEYTVKQNNAAGTGSTGHNRFMAAEVTDLGGGLTYWGEGSNHDVGMFSQSIASFSYVNDLPVIQHDNTTEEFIGYDHSTSAMSLRVRIHDDGALSRTGHRNDPADVSLTYYVSPDGSEPDNSADFTTIHDLESAPQSCFTGVNDFYDAFDLVDDETFDFFGTAESIHRGSGLPLQCDYWRSEVDGNSQNGGWNDDGENEAVGEMYEVILDVPEGSTLYYSFSVEDSDEAVAETGIFEYVVGILPEDEDPSRADIVGPELASIVQNYYDATDIADSVIYEAIGTYTDNGDPYDTDEDGDTSEYNSQSDVTERFVAYFDNDEGEHDTSFNDKYDGQFGTSVHLGATDPSDFSAVDHMVIRVGDSASTPDLSEFAMVDYPGIGAICVIEHPGHPLSVHVSGAAGFQPEAGEDACGPALEDEGAPLNAVIVDNDEYLGFIVFTDNDGDGERKHAEGRSANPLAGSPEDAFGIYVSKAPTGPGDVHAITGPRDPIDREIPTTVEDITFSDVDIDRYTVSWTEASDDVGVDHYSVYTSNVTISDLDKATVTNVTDATTLAFTDVELGSVQYVVVTAVDAKGKESHLSNVTSVDLPDPAIVLSKTEVTADEGADAIQYTINVNDLPKPNKKIAIDLEVIDNSEFLADPITVDLERVELNAAAYEAGGLSINISFPDDDFGMGDRTYIIRHSVDPTKVGHDLRFDGASDADLTVTVREDDVEPAISLADEVGLVTEEGSGDNVTFDVSLSRRPTDDVFVHVSVSNDTRLRQTTPHYLLFGIHDWDEPKQVTLTAPDNDRVDGDKKIQVLLEIDTEDSAIEFIDRAPSRQVIVTVEDDEIDTDEDGILDSLDDDPNDRFNKDYRPSEFEYEMSADGSAIRFTWTAEHLDERIDRYIIWQFSEPTNVGEFEVIDGQREYDATIAFGGGVHDFALQPVLERDNGEYDEEAAVPLGSKVFTDAYYQEVCGSGNDTAKDSDEDGICDAFEEELGTDPDEADSDGDGRTDHQEVFLDSTDASNPESHYTVIPAWGTNPWMIIGSVLVLASLVLAIVSLVQQSRARSRRSNAVRS